MRALPYVVALLVAAAPWAVVQADTRVAQNTGPVDRGAAGSGSMGMGEGVRPSDRRQDEPDWPEEQAPAMPSRDDAEPDHATSGRTWTSQGLQVARCERRLTGKRPEGT